MRDGIAMGTREGLGSKLRLHVLRVHRPKWPCALASPSDYGTTPLRRESSPFQRLLNTCGREIPTRWLSSYLHRFAKQRDFWPVRRLNSTCRIGGTPRDSTATFRRRA